MHKILLLTCSVCFMSMVALADDTTSEPCAGGTGFIFVGKVTGHKYCASNNSMNWWNAVSWCDSINMELFDLNDCHWEQATNLSVCPEATDLKARQMSWTKTPTQNNKWHVVEADTGYIKYTYTPNYGWYVLCK